MIGIYFLWTSYKEKRERRLRATKDRYWTENPIRARQELSENWESLCAQRAKLLERGCRPFSQGRWERRIWQIDRELQDIRIELERQTGLSPPKNQYAIQTLEIEAQLSPGF